MSRINKNYLSHKSFATRNISNIVFLFSVICDLDVLFAVYCINIYLFTFGKTTVGLEFQSHIRFAHFPVSDNKISFLKNHIPKTILRILVRPDFDYQLVFLIEFGTGYQVKCPDRQVITY